MPLADQAKAEPEPGHGVPLYPRRARSLGFHFTDYFSLFLPKKCDFITIRDNRGIKYQKMDQVRKLIDRHYEHYVIVRSPKNGIHFHVLASRSGARTFKVPKGIHTKVTRVGLPIRSYKNRRYGDPMTEPSVNEEVRSRPITEATASSKNDPKAMHIARILGYMYLNMLENEMHYEFDTIYTKW